MINANDRNACHVVMPNRNPRCLERIPPKLDLASPRLSLVAVVDRPYLRAGCWAAPDLLQVGRSIRAGSQDLNLPGGFTDPSWQSWWGLEDAFVKRPHRTRADLPRMDRPPCSKSGAAPATGSQ